jgi:hypothetical protein
MLKRTALAVAAVVPLVIAPGFFVGSASAATSDEHCGLLADSGEYACFSSIAEVDQWAEQEAGQEAARGVAALAATSFLHAIFYEKNNKTGDSLSMYGSTACDNNADWDFQYGNFTANGWDNKISSFQGYSNCEVKLFEHDNANSGSAGSSYGPYASSNYVGDAMNDQASSARFY